MDPTRSNEDLAAELVKLALTDQSQPPEWALDKALKALELVTLQKGEFQRYADICGNAAMADEVYFDKHEARLLLLLGVLNGIRRLVPPPEDKVTELAHEIDFEATQSLQPGPRADRIWGFFKYQMGIYTGAIGNYELAADLQSSAAERAEAQCNLAERAMSWFREAMERFNAALVEGNVLPEHLAQINDTFVCLVEQAEATPTDDLLRWVGLNAPMFRLVAYYWDRQDNPHADEDIAALETFGKQFPDVLAANQSGVDVAIAAAYCRQYKFAKADALAAKVIAAPTPHTPPELIATAHLIRDDCDPDGDKEHLQAILAMPTGAHQVKALARRLMERE